MWRKTGSGKRVGKGNSRAGTGRRRSLALAAMMALLTGIALVAVSVLFGLTVSLVALCLILMLVVWYQARTGWVAFQRRLDKMAVDYEAVIDVLCGALDLRDSVTAGQSRRVSRLASVVAWQMGLRKEDVQRVEKAAILHDIGKTGIDQKVLSKPGALTEAEWAEMKRHPELGYRILKGIGFLSDVADIVRSHHERFDGQGYPQGLKSDEIPLGARIFAVVDAYAAMTTDRPYRRRLAHEIVVKEIVRNSLTQFDPQVVQAFLEAEQRGLLRQAGREGAGEAAPAPVPSEV